MQVTPIKTEIIRPHQSSIEQVIDHYLERLEEGSVVAVASKIVSLCEGAVVPKEGIDKVDLIRQQAEQYIPREQSAYHQTITLKRQVLARTAGIDESNGEGLYILWPSQPQQTANRLRAHLAQRFQLQRVGVVVADSRTTPLRRGTTGVALAHSGFMAVNSYIGTPDLFGKPLRSTQANIADALATSAVLTMGEGREQTPLAVITDVPFVQFQPRNPTQEELDDLQITLEEDFYAPILTKADWQPGGG